MQTNWQTKELGDICEFHNGLWKGKKPPFIKISVIRNTNFTKEGRLDNSNIALLNRRISASLTSNQETTTTFGAERAEVLATFQAV